MYVLFSELLILFSLSSTARRANDMYKIGEWIFYGNFGACRIEDIRAVDSKDADKSRLHYILQPSNQTCMIFTPIDSTKNPMRRIISKDEAKRLIDTIPALHTEVYECQDWRQLTEYYSALIKSCECAQLLKLTVSIQQKKEQKCKLNATDEKYLRMGETLLLGELSAALDIPQSDVSMYIKARVQALNEKHNLQAK